MARWPASPEALVEAQVRLGREAPAADWAPSPDMLVAGCFVCFARGLEGRGSVGDAGFAAAVALRRGQPVSTAVRACTAGAPYVPGLLGLRVGPALEEVVRALSQRPDVVLLDATGRDHPRRAGLALQLGAVTRVPTVGVTHRTLLARGRWPGDARGSRSELVLDGEVVGYWLRTRRGRRPLAVHGGWRIDSLTAVEVVLAVTTVARTPEPLRLARMLARERRAGA